MRHRVANRKLGRVTEHRIAMLRNQARGAPAARAHPDDRAEGEGTAPVRRAHHHHRQARRRRRHRAAGAERPPRSAARHPEQGRRRQAVHRHRPALRVAAGRLHPAAAYRLSGRATRPRSPRSSCSGSSSTRRRRPPRTRRRPRPSRRASARRLKAAADRLRGKRTAEEAEGQTAAAPRPRARRAPPPARAPAGAAARAGSRGGPIVQPPPVVEAQAGYGVTSPQREARRRAAPRRTWVGASAPPCGRAVRSAARPVVTYGGAKPWPDRLSSPWFLRERVSALRFRGSQRPRCLPKGSLGRRTCRVPASTPSSPTCTSGFQSSYSCWGRCCSWCCGRPRRMTEAVRRR